MGFPSATISSSLETSNELPQLPQLAEVKEFVGKNLQGILHEDAERKSWTDNIGTQEVMVGPIAYNTVSAIVDAVRDEQTGLLEESVIQHLKEVFSKMSSEDSSNEEYREVGKRCFNALIWYEHDAPLS